MKSHTRLAALLIACSLMPVAWAGRSCEEHQPSPLQISESLQLAQQSYSALEQSGASVAIIARAGQDLSRYGLAYSHLALVWRDHPEGRWTVIHELNECGTDHADLFNQGLGDFFMDDMYAYRTLIMVPSPALQIRITDALAHGRTKETFSPHYNMLAYPFSTQFQNSNQWALEFLAESMAQDVAIHDRQSAQNWLQVADYRPSVLQISAFERLGADLTRANISFDDHPFERRMTGQIDTVTVDSIERFLKVRDPGMREMTLDLKR